MWEGYYGKEPFDLRLTVFRLFRQLWMVLGVTLAGTLLFGGGYFVKNVLLRGEKLYRVTSVYRVDYNVEDKDVNQVYINGATWNTYVHSQEFLDRVQSRLDQVRILMDSMTLYMDNETLAEYVECDLATDLRMPSVIVTSPNPWISEYVARAVEAVMTEEFPELIREIDKIRVVDPAGEAREVIPDVRPVRALVLSGLLSCFFAVILLILKELNDDSIWLPAELGRRYGLKVLGTVESPELLENMGYLFQGKKTVAVCPVQENADPGRAAEALAEICRQSSKEEAGTEASDIQWIPVPSLVLCPESCRILREADGILAVVKAGRHSGRRLEYALDFLRQQDCQVTAALLWEADEKLIRWYYKLPGAQRQRTDEKPMCGG